MKNSVFVIQHIGNRKKFYLSALPPVTKLIPLHAVVVLHYTLYIKNGMIGQRGRGCQNAQEQFIVKAH